jgi:hypothetical protein
MTDITPGFYRHYSGKNYEVLGIARHSETLEEMVVYKALYASEFPEGQLWVSAQGDVWRRGYNQRCCSAAFFRSKRIVIPGCNGGLRESGNPEMLLHS